MSVMFAIQDRLHADTLVQYVLFSMGVSQEYLLERKSLTVIRVIHNQTFHNPNRAQAPPGAGCPGKGFTVSQRDTWKATFLEALVNVGGVHEGSDLYHDFCDWIDMEMQPYGPFEPDRTV
eukprot:PhF_6_TR22719/c0_g1_i2/m.32366